MAKWVVSHDAGGAAQIASRLKAEGVDGWSFVLEGPAQKVFSQKLGSLPVKTREDFRRELAAADSVLTGTGWASDLEKFALSHAREVGASSVAFLDHWGNYRLRFEHEGKLVLPDEIWVSDADALVIARRDLPEANVRQVQNHYLQDAVAEIRAAERSARAAGKKIEVLYVCEAISERVGSPASGELPEHAALTRFLDWLSRQENIGSVRLRPHPADREGKYARFTGGRYSWPIALSQGTSLPEDCAWADWVAGMSSAALVVALGAGKRVISCMPAGQSCPLPQKSIERI